MSIVTKIVQAVAKVLPDRGRDELAGAHTYIGKPVDRLEGREKVTGGTKFSAEYALPNLAHAALVYSTIAKGSIQAIDISDAEKLVGVIAIITHENAPPDEGSAVDQS